MRTDDKPSVYAVHGSLHALDNKMAYPEITDSSTTPFRTFGPNSMVVLILLHSGSKSRGSWVAKAQLWQ